jgi:hypothetical protein
MLKTVSNLVGLSGTLAYQGLWNANTNTPTLTSSVGTLNNYYVVSVAGTTNLNGITNWSVGDWAIFNGTTWERLDGGAYGAVSQVGGTGTVNGITLTGNVTSAGNLTLGGTLSNVTNSQLANSSTTLGNATLTLGSVTSSVGNLTLANVTITSGTINVQTSNLTSTTAGNATFSTSSLLLVPAGFFEIDLNGTVVKVPYYGV